MNERRPIIEDEAYDIRYSEEGDLDALRSWIRDSSVLPYYPPLLEEEIESWTKNWIGFARIKASLTACYGGERVGIVTLFLMPYRKLAHQAMLCFVVTPSFVGRGVGSSLVKNGEHLARHFFRVKKLFLETVDSCPALSLLSKRGYRQVIYQAGYFKVDGHYHARVVVEKEL